jgi:hypothetical protein
MKITINENELKCLRGHVMEALKLLQRLESGSSQAPVLDANEKMKMQFRAQLNAKVRSNKIEE